MRKFLRELYVYSGLTLSALIIISGALYVSRYIAEPYSWLSFVAGVALFVALFSKLENVLKRSIHALQADEAIDYRQFLKNFSSALITIVDLNKLTDVIVKTLCDFYDLDSVALYLYNDAKNMYLLSHASGVIEYPAVIDNDSPLIEWFGERRTIINRPRIDSHKHGDLIATLRELSAEMSIPLFFRDRLIGVLNLGRKKSNKDFTDDDEDSFLALEGQISVAINNAILFKAKEESHLLLAQKNKMDAIIALSSGINHEINNPLSIISMRCQNFLRKLSSGKFITPSAVMQSAQEVIESCLRNANRAHLITKRLANFAQPVREKVDFQPINVRDAVQECIDLIGKKQFFGDNIVIDITIAETIAAVYADKVQFQQILYNIVMNAYHAITRNGMIRFRAYEKGSKRIVLEIEDTGTGITEENLKKIWEPFFTTKPTNPLPGEKATGSGLGLALVKRYVESSGGTIAVHSKEGKGTIFKLTFIKVPEEQHAECVNR